MKTVNIISDFIIIGFTGLFSILFPIYMLDDKILIELIDNEFWNYAIFIPVITLLIYVWGIVFNQISDWFVKIFQITLKLDKIKAIEKKMEKDLNESYHCTLQNIVVESKSSFEYLSYRRTMIRIFRSLLVGFIFVIILHLIISIISFFFMDIEFSERNFVIILALFIFMFFFRYTYVRLYLGYYDAIQNFSRIINKKNTVNNSEE